MGNDAFDSRLDTVPAAGSALVVVDAGVPLSPVKRILVRPDPSFLMHLIAVAQDAPQSRTVRRRSQREAIQLYADKPPAQMINPALLCTT